MRKPVRLLLLLSVVSLLFVFAAYGQDDQPSLGDVARQSRLQKQQKDAQAAKDAQSKDAQSKDASAKDGQNQTPQSKDAQGKDTDAALKDTPSAKTPHVITNDEIPEHVGPTGTAGQNSQNSRPGYSQPEYSQGNAGAETWRAQIQQVKTYIASLKSNIDSLTASIQYAGGNCVSGCVQWNERQKQKQDQVDAMKAQLDQMQQRLEDMQEACRKQGYGSSVYDP